MEKNPEYIYFGAKVQIICLLLGNKLSVKLPIKKLFEPASKLSIWGYREK